MGLPQEVVASAVPSAAGLRPLHRLLLQNLVPLLLPRFRSNLPHPNRPTPLLLDRRLQEVERPVPDVREGETERGAT